MTDYNNNSSITTTSRVTKRTSRPYHHDYTSSFDEAEESDSYTSRRSRRLSESNHRRIGSTYGLSYVSNKRMERMEINEDESNNVSPSRRRYTRKWETDDELFKPNHRSSMPIMSQQQNSPQISPVNNYPDEASTIRNLLYLLNKERTKRREIQNGYDTSVQTLKELQQNHQDDLNTLESDIQTLQDALVKEAKANIQLNKLLRESTSKFTEEMQTWANKVVLMEEQGKELQETFQETMEQLEKEEEEIDRLRKENQSLRDQMAGRAIEPANLNRINLEDVRKVGSMEDRDDVSVSAESKQECISDNESVANYSKLTELNDRIIELENELITSKENTQKVESSFQQLETDKTSTIKQLEEKHLKTVSLLRATLKQKQIKIEELEKELRKAKYNENERKEKILHPKPISHKPSQQFSSPPSPKLQHLQPLEQDDEEDLQPVNDDWRNHHRPGQMRRRSIISENLPTKERKNSLTSTNSGSIEGTSVTGGSLEDKGEGEVEQSEMSSEEEEEEEEERDDQSSSVFTGSDNSRNGSEEIASVQDPNTLGRQQHYQLNKDSDVAVEEDDVILDAILSDREDCSLPLIGHYSAAEFTEDEDFDFDYRRPSFAGIIGGNKIEGNSMVMALNQINSGRRGRSGDDGIP
ncbi:15415_t:CDS:2 [Funneliformis geosporum]|uniref:15415_t:CDS:1 n=1 Tax=Funneliformis geosporum TaxID=1117311 RepID=A0A9W4WI53_9GLOM|nr:15415_t:CDS:2 [Funneliformis geosporum]